MSSARKLDRLETFDIEQIYADPLSNELTCYVHKGLKDGSLTIVQDKEGDYGKIVRPSYVSKRREAGDDSTQGSDSCNGQKRGG